MSSTKMSNKNVEICLISDVKRYKIREKLYKIVTNMKQDVIETTAVIIFQEGEIKEELKKDSKSAGNRGRMTEEVVKDEKKKDQYRQEKNEKSAVNDGQKGKVSKEEYKR